MVAGKTDKEIIRELRRRVAELEALEADHKQAEKALRESEQRFRSVVDNVIYGIVTISEQGIVESFNQTAEQLFGYTAAEVIGQNLSMLMTEPHRLEHDYLKTGEKKIIDTGRETIGRHKNGTTFPMELALSEFHLGGCRLFTGIIRDITERRHLEAQLLQAQKMESIGQLAGGMAHDFNNQLGIILFDLELLLASPLPADAPLRDDLNKIRKVVVRSADLTRQLLLFSRRQPMSMQSISLNHQVEDLQRMLERLLGEPITVDLDLDRELWVVSADTSNMAQVVTNLAINARDAMPQGGVLRMETKNIMVDQAYCRKFPQARPGPFVRLAVSDTGEGMDEGTRAHLFEPFFTTKEAGKGTGLGLAVVYGIVQAHEGWISVESQPDQGTRFEIYLPALVTGTEKAATSYYSAIAEF